MAMVARTSYAKQKVDASADEAIVLRPNEMTEESAPVRVSASMASERWGGEGWSDRAMESSLCSRENFRVCGGRKEESRQKFCCAFCRPFYLFQIAGWG